MRESSKQKIKNKSIFLEINFVKIGGDILACLQLKSTQKILMLKIP